MVRMRVVHNDLGYAQIKNQARVLTWNRKNSRERARFGSGRIKIPYGFDPVSNFGWSIYRLGLLMHDAGHTQQAAECFREVIERFNGALAERPADDGIRQMLRWALLTCPLSEFRDPERAFSLCNQAWKHDPGFRDDWNHLGIALYRLGRWAEAIAALEESTRLNSGGDSYDFYYLSMAYGQLGDVDAARSWLERAVEHKDNDWPVINYFYLQSVYAWNAPLLRAFRKEAEALLGIEDPASAIEPPDAKDLP